MAPKKMKTVVWSCVPEEIVYEILSWLPVKSVSRFRCVSKSWFSIISDPKFISLHFDHSLAKPKVMLISAPAISSSADKFCELVCTVDYAEWGISKWRDQPQSLVADYHGLIRHDCYFTRPCFSVGGLSLAKSYWKSDNLLICNPSTRESIRFKLPRNPIDNIRYCHNKSYLGFDPVEKKHKVLSTWIHRRPYKCWNYVITLGEDAWRPVECKYNHDLYFDSVNNICIDGVIYYLLRDGSSVNLIGFNVHLETFTSISVPLDNWVEVPPFLMEYGGFATVVYKNDKDEHQVIVMAMLIDNDKWKYEEYFVLQEVLHRWENYLMGSTPNNELAFVFRDISCLMKLECYDLETKNMKEIKVLAPKDQKRIGLDFRRVKVCPHVEMLQSLQGLSPDFYHYQRY